MKHFVKISLSLLLVLALLAGCSGTVKAEDLAGKRYVYEKDGFGGPFTIDLKEDGSFNYYEGMLSSYIGMGEWTLEGDTLTLREKDQWFAFRVEKENLVFRKEMSGKFLFTDVADGDKFTVQS